MSLNIPHQSEFFYKSNWTPEIDSLMLRTIIRMKNKMNWTGTLIPSHFLLEAEAAIEEEIGVRFTWDALYDRLQFLESRYRAFKEVVDVPETYWEVHSNTIIAMDQVWKEIFKKNKLAGAYYHRGEPEFQHLAMLFGSNDVKQEDEKNMIIISDTTISIRGNKSGSRNRAATSEEVTSPVAAQGTRLRRKLFEAQPQPLDLASTNEKDHDYAIVYPDGEMKYRLQNVFPPQKLVEKPPGSPHGSSCASSSPSKWWRNPSK